MTLPPPIAAYFAAEPGDDGDALVAPFAADAVVSDESNSHVGHAAIRAWWAAARASYSPATEVLGVTEDAGVTTVRGRVSGSFPNSPVELDFRFTLDAGRIARLEIG
ncbi:MAG: nuclear transport factor 2 family protein [Pseudomonadota bacterium]